MNIQGFYTGREFDADTFFGAHPYEDGTHLLCGHRLHGMERLSPAA